MTPAGSSSLGSTPKSGAEPPPRSRVSPATGRPYPLTLICEVWRVPRSTVYAARDRDRREASPPQKRGPKTQLSDEVLVKRIREVLKESDFLGEGHRKVRFRLRA